MTTRIQHHPINPRGGHDYVVGDIHGELDLLLQLLRRKRFGSDDRLFCVGDLVDRGPLSFELLQWYAEQPNVFSVRGNHEEMLLEAFRAVPGTQARGHHRMNGGDWFYRLTDKAQRFAVDTIEEMPHLIDIQVGDSLFGIVHAEVTCAMSSWQELHYSNPLPISTLWGRHRLTHRTEQLVQGVEWVVCGHTPLQDPLRLGNHLFIDTGACFEQLGKLTLVDLGSCTLFEEGKHEPDQSPT